MLQRFYSALRRLKGETLTLYYAARDRRTPWYAKAFVVLVVAYAFSPIDLIPDFIPVLGFVDEIILLPIAIWLALRMIPAPVVLEARHHAAALAAKKPRILWGALLIVLIWMLFVVLFGFLIYRVFST